MIRFIVAALLLTTNVFAGLPPTALKGQGGSNVTTFNYQVPMNQATQISGPTSLIETGNGNFLANPGFEGTTGWTASGGATAAINTTAVGTGLNGYNWDSNSASQTLRGDSVTIPNAWKGQLGVAECFVKTPSGTATHTIGVYDGSSLLSSTAINSNTIFVPSKHFFIFPSSGTLTVQLTSVASNEPEVYIDDCYLGLLSQHPSGGSSAAITAPTAYTPTYGSGLGTVTNNSAFYMQIGSTLRMWGFGTTGTVAASIGSVSIPPICTLDASKLGVNNTTAASGQKVGDFEQNSTTAIGPMVVAPATSTSLIYFGGNAGIATMLNPATSVSATSLASNKDFSWNATIPCSNLASVVNTATTPIITAYTAYTPTFTGFGTVTVQNIKYRQVGGEVQIEGRFTSGTSTTTEARISLPPVCSASASDYVTLEYAGGRATTNNGAPSSQMLIEPSVTYLTFSREISGSSASLAKANGNVIAGSGDSISFNAKVRCAGMPGVIPAPNLVGFGTNNGTSAIRIEGASLAAPSAGACAVTEVGGSDWINGNCVSGATGVCTCTLNSGIFSAAPKCQISVENLAAGNSRDEQITSTSTSTIVTFTATSGGTAVNNDVFIMCMGAR